MSNNRKFFEQGKIANVLASKSLSIEHVSIVKKRSYPELETIKKNLQVSDHGEVCLAIGGDGTFLRASEKFNCPILHIRSGERNSLGCRADVSLSKINEIIEDLKQGRYIIERYPKLQITYRNQTYNAVNDAVLFRADPKNIHFAVNYYDNEGNELPLYPKDVKGDGIIFTRQIGSTAYNYFTHGPILFDVDAFVVTPISTNYAFSIVTNKSFKVQITRNIGFLEYDGVNIAKLSERDFFTVTKSDKTVKIVRLRLREKFSDKLARLKNF
jgi:NAD+ kinase